MSNQFAIEALSVSKSFQLESGFDLLVLDRLSFSIKTGEIVGIIGPSGCGKTTLLRCISGLIQPSAGKIIIGEEPVPKPDTHTVLVFQDYSKSLFPWKTVAGNVKFGLEGLALSRSAADEAVESSLRIVGLLDFANEFPWRLSGGMQQRVALARAIIRKPRVLLMDEPFGSLDAYTRYALEDELLSLASRLGITILLVTHDIDEAAYLSDRVLVLSQRPASLIGNVTMNLARPRSQLATRSSGEFGKLRGELQQYLQQYQSSHETIPPQ